MLFRGSLSSSLASSPRPLPSISASQSSSPSAPSPSTQSSPPLTPSPPTPQLAAQQQLPTQSQLTTPLKSPIFNFDESQFSTYDIPNTKLFNDKENRRLFHQFVDAYEDFYDKRAEQNSVDIDLNKRLNIIILIIVLSSIDCIQSRFIDGIYQKNAEDLSTALLLRHLFHNSYGIPYNQILITSTQESDFYVKDTETELISQPNTIFKGVNDSFLEKTDFHFTNKNEIEFMLHQKINIAQVGDKQYKFFMKESLASIVKPFNINIIKKELTTNDNSDLLVFFLDHGHTGGFSDDFPYQFFIERLLEISCKYFYVFNDSCGSGSLIKLINISRDFQRIFPNIQDPTLESAMFYFLTNLNKVYPAGVKDAIESKLYKIDLYECSSKIKEEMITRLNQINESSYQQISDFVLSFDVEIRSVGCVPQHFLQFAKKATIFTSSLYNEKSLTLPGRKIFQFWIHLELEYLAAFSVLF